MSSKARTVSFISASGGVGKTTLSIFLAKWVIDRRHVSPLKLLLVDLDPTAGLSLSLMTEEEYEDKLNRGFTLVNLYDDYSKGMPWRKISDYVTSVKHEGVSLNVLIPGEELGRVVEELWRTGRPGKKFQEMLYKSGAYTLYDFIIFDTAPFFDIRYTVLSIYAAEKHVVVLRPSVVDCRRTARMLKNLMEYASDFDRETSEYVKRFLGVINLARTGTIEWDVLMSLGFNDAGAKLDSKQDQRREKLKEELEGLMRVIEFSKYALTLKVDIARLELKEAVKKEKVMEALLNRIWEHAVK